LTQAVLAQWVPLAQQVLWVLWVLWVLPEQVPPGQQVLVDLFRLR
jgi:hypothetical protein